IAEVERSQRAAVVAANLRATKRLGRVAENGLNPCRLPVANGKALSVAIVALLPVIDRRLIQRDHHPLVFRRSLLFLDQVPRLVEAVRSEVLVCGGDIETRLGHDSMLLNAPQSFGNDRSAGVPARRPPRCSAKRLPDDELEPRPRVVDGTNLDIDKAERKR